MDKAKLPHRILVVDDLNVMKRLMTQFLNNMGFENVLQADNARDALVILKSEKVDLVISDWMMPDVDGLMFLKEIRNDEKLKDLPFLMVTLLDQKENIVKAAQARVSDYLIKPLNSEVFQAKVKKLLGLP
ncbi:MAG: response regulator [Nitrospinae bacterium]|nr:response regulator [Nitrospinota bacterium]